MPSDGLQLVHAHDFSSARAHLICSVPGWHKGEAMTKWGHVQLRTLLEKVGGWAGG